MATTSTATEQLISGVDFVALHTHDIDGSVAFYRDTLGLPMSVHVPERNYAEFEAGNLTLSVLDAEKMGLEHHPSRQGIALHVADVEAARKQLQERGVSFDVDTLDTGVCHMAFFSDPEGNAFLLHHRYAPRSPQA
jgi:predicted enzyme related to lactoylglutathione lyase